MSIGLVAGDGGAVGWPLMMSLLKAKEYLFTGDRIPAPLAVELGLANRVVPDDEVVAEAVALAHRLSQQPQQALQETKRALNLHLQAAIQNVAPFALSSEAESFATEDVKNTVDGFKDMLEKQREGAVGSAIGRAIRQQRCDHQRRVVRTFGTSSTPS